MVFDIITFKLSCTHLGSNSLFILVGGERLNLLEYEIAHLF